MNQIIRFSIYQHTLLYNNNQLLRRNFIVLKHGNTIIAWTDFHKYIRSSHNRIVSPLDYNNRAQFQYVIKLLNYIFFEKHHINKLNDITAEMVKSFLIEYGQCKLIDDNEHTHRTESTVKQCISSITEFLEVYIRHNKSCKFQMKDLFEEKDVFSRKQKKFVKQTVPTFEVFYNSENSPIFRDITESAFKILINQVIKKHRNILMLVTLSSFAGLRPSEACNVRRPDSQLGQGLRFDRIGNEVTNVYIDLKQELNLRSDMKPVGGIKKRREQKVYPNFLSVFCECYNLYMSYIKGKSYEEDYGALTTNRMGMAYTYDSYYQEFQKVKDECIPIMLQNDDPKVVHYGQMLMENSLSPHIFRHWFSMKLAMFGVTTAELMYWRGDKSPESALTYINNKSDIVNQLGHVMSEAFDYSMYLAKLGKEKDDND